MLSWVSGGDSLQASKLLVVHILKLKVVKGKVLQPPSLRVCV